MSQAPKIISDLLAYLQTEAAKAHDEFLTIDDPIIAPTGSRVICTPPTMDTDDDWLVWVPEKLQEDAISFLERAGATYSDQQKIYPDGVCFRYEDVNPVLIWDYQIFYRWVAATYWARKLNLQDKKERVLLFQSMVDGRVPIETMIL
jgi:hypothetical protein